MARQTRLDTELFTEDIDSGCWLFNGSLSHNGYGQLKRKGTHIRAHRYFYEKYVGQIPDGMVIDHTCREPQCIKPSHLKIVTQAKNTQLGRSAKLTENHIEEIKMLHQKGYNQYDIGMKYGVGQSVISRIINGKTWRP